MTGVELQSRGIGLKSLGPHHPPLKGHPFFSQSDVITPIEHDLQRVCPYTSSLMSLIINIIFSWHQTALDIRMYNWLDQIDKASAKKTP